MSTIHIAASLDYLFPNTAGTARVICGILAQAVFNRGEFIGILGNLNLDCKVCKDCLTLAELENSNVTENSGN